MKRWGEQKPLRLDEREMKTNLGSGNFIFVGSSCDVFADDVPDEWIERVLYYIDNFPDNKYLFQTKDPERFLSFEGLSAKENVMLGATIETNRNYTCMGKTPMPIDRAAAMDRLLCEKFVTIEPILDFDLKSFVGVIGNASPEKVFIGADSGNNHLPEPSKEKVLELIAELEKFTKVILKKNLRRLSK
jgi:protein gp37